MIYTERNRDDVSLYNISEIFHLELKKILMSSVCGRVFLEDSNGRLLGAFSLDKYVTGKDVAQFDYPPVVKESKDLDRQVADEVTRNSNEGIFPVIDDDGHVGRFICASSDLWKEDMLNALSKIAYLVDKKMNLGYYFTSRGIKRIALWGCNRLSLTLAVILMKIEGVEFLGIFENQRNKAFVKEDILNYPVEVSFVSSINDLEPLNIEKIFICDWTMRNVGNVISFTNSQYIVHWLNSKELYLDINVSMYLECKKWLADRGVCSYAVRIPTEGEMGIKERKKDKFSANARWKYFAKETGYPIESQELKDFNVARQTLTKAIIKRNGGVYFSDFSSKDYNYMQGKRFVPNVEHQGGRRIILLGPCIVSAQFSKDDQTLGYYLQEICNAKKNNIEVVMLGLPNDADRYYYFRALKKENPKSGDVVVYLEQSFRNAKYELDALPIFKDLYKKYGQDFYYDIPIHCGKEAAKAVAKFLAEKCLETESKILSPINTNTEGTLVEKNKGNNLPLPYEGNPDLIRYKEFLQKNKIHRQLSVGAIVMNANPFTLGHQYLIEQAAGQTDVLYVFVVEEDKSYFSFVDRIKMVMMGTRYLKNVKVLPSGKFIISSITFSDYFDKENLQGNVVDTSLDLETFARQIAPCLDIVVRFVGEEPFDKVTRQYNTRMKEILPQYGIELKEIPRKEDDGEPISASRVRRYLQNNEWGKIHKIVPETTFNYLKELAKTKV